MWFTWFKEKLFKDMKVKNECALRSQKAADNNIYQPVQN